MTIIVVTLGLLHSVFHIDDAYFMHFHSFMHLNKHNTTINK
jgi:hypothetical protein